MERRHPGFSSNPTGSVLPPSRCRGFGRNRALVRQRHTGRGKRCQARASFQPAASGEVWTMLFRLRRDVRPLASRRLLLPSSLDELDTRARRGRSGGPASIYPPLCELAEDARVAATPAMSWLSIDEAYRLGGSTEGFQNPAASHPARRGTPDG